MTIAKELRLNDNNDDVLYSKHVEKDILKHYEEENNKKLIIQSKNQELLNLRKQQIDDQKQRLINEKIKTRKFEYEILETAASKLQREKEIILEAKQRDRDIRMQIERDNIENKRILAIGKYSIV